MKLEMEIDFIHRTGTLHEVHAVSSLDDFDTFTLVFGNMSDEQLEEIDTGSLSVFVSSDPFRGNILASASGFVIPEGGYRLLRESSLHLSTQSMHDYVSDLYAKYSTDDSDSSSSDSRPSPENLHVYFTVRDDNIVYARCRVPLIAVL